LLPGTRPVFALVISKLPLWQLAWQGGQVQPVQPWDAGAWAELLPLEVLLWCQGTGRAEPTQPQALPGLL